MSEDRIRIGVLGASGYTGVDLLRLLAEHPAVDVRVMTANTHAGKRLGEIYPHLDGRYWPELVRNEEASWDEIDVVFCCLPHGMTQEIVVGLPGHLKVIDLSADFRLNDPETYATWYGHEHRALNLQSEAVYGLTEINRAQISQARLVACPGCYPTAVLLPLIPLVYGKWIEPTDLIIDAKSGVSGAGRSLKESLLYCETAEGMNPYSVGKHRHAPEIEQELSAWTEEPVVVNFTPHLVPMNRGELVTIYARLAEGVGAADIRNHLAGRFESEPFVHVAAEGAMPATRHVRGSNHCVIGVFEDRLPGRVVIVAVIDNLVKGSSGQALQNMNLMCGLGERTGLNQAPLFP